MMDREPRDEFSRRFLKGWVKRGGCLAIWAWELWRMLLIARALRTTLQNWELDLEFLVSLEMETRPLELMELRITWESECRNLTS
jgi:hypothetical protein